VIGLSTPRVRCRRSPGTRAAIVLGLLFCAPASGATRVDTATAIRGIIDSGAHPLARGRSLGPDREVLRSAYASRMFEPLWTQAGQPTAQAGAVVGVLRQADGEGLLPSSYDVELLAKEIEKLGAAGQATAREVAAFDVALSIAAMRFASDSHRGRIDPRRAGLKRLFPPKPIDLVELLTRLARAVDPAEALAALAPPFPAYAQLKQALVQVRALAARDDLPQVPQLPKQIPCDARADLAPVRALLTILGDLPLDTPEPSDPNVHDEALVAAVRRFQQRHGLDPDAVIGPATLRQLRMPMSKRVEQVRLGLERLRWLPSELPERFIVVNIPEFRLRAYESGQASPVLTMDVVVGSAGARHETPILRADMRQVIFRPNWNIPGSITHKEMMPEIRQDPVGYFDKQNLEIVGRDGELLPLTLENLGQLQLGEARLRQRPGPKNSLGLVKFVFPNPDDIYFHDTPSKSLFRRSRRDFSHGCVRVADPVALAEYALQGAGDWNRSRIEAAMRSTDPRKTDIRIPLKSPVTVYLWYTTVVPGEDGTVIFLDDIYGHDGKLARLLARSGAES
jgi:murein L,D-transpeptidase YcbB/YkuD